MRQECPKDKPGFLFDAAEREGLSKSAVQDLTTQYPSHQTQELSSSDHILELMLTSNEATGPPDALAVYTDFFEQSGLAAQ